MFRKYKLDILVESGLPQDYLSLNIDLLRMFGFWPKENTFTSSRRLLLGWPIVIIILYVTLFLTEVIDVYFIWGNIQSVSETLCVSFTVVNMTFKMAHFICRNHQIQRLVEDLRVESSGWDSDDNENQNKVLRECVKRARRLTLAGYTLVVLTCLIWTVMSYGLGRDDGTRTLPMRAWYPFDVSVSPFYEIASIVQITTLCFMAYTYISFTVFYAVLIIHACGNLTVLRGLLADTRERAERRTRKSMLKKNSRNNVNEMLNKTPTEKQSGSREVPIDDATLKENIKVVSFIDVETSSLSVVNKDRIMQVPEDMISSRMVRPERALITPTKSPNPLKRNVPQLQGNKEAEINIAAHRCLAEVVRFHQTILRFIKDLDAVFRPILTIQLIFSLLIIGQIAFQATILFNQTDGLIKFASYFSCALTELLLYCWYNEELNHQARLVADSAYSCDWFTSTPGFKRSLQIVMLRSQRSEMTPGRTTITMSCHTCTLILKNSYSLFALLKQLGEKTKNV